MAYDGIFKTEAQALIAQLFEKGWTRIQLARALGRDPKMISYAARGEKPFRNGVEALRRLLLMDKKDVKVPVARRTSKAGGLANVRGGLIQELKGGRLAQTKQDMDFLLETLAQAASEGRKVNLNVRFDHLTKKEGDQVRHRVTTSVYGRGIGDKRGYYASSLLKRVRSYAGTRGLTEADALNQLLVADATYAAEENYDEQAGEIEQFSMTFYDA